MIFYLIMSLFDMLIYKLIATIFKIILYLADIQVLSDGVIGDLTNKVYAFLAVLMFFKIAISTIQYIVNPDELSNSDKGIGGILKNSAIAIILLVVVPEIFHFARSQQSYIAGFIPSIILDVEYKGESNADHVTEVNEQADNMAAMTFNAFVLKKDGTGTAPIGKRSGSTTGFDWDLVRADDSASNKEANEIEGSIYYGCKHWCVDNMLFHFCLPLTFDSSDCNYDYMMIWSTVAGVLMTFVLVSMAIDIAIRAIKLSILEVMAPIPIVSYIDKAKGGAFEAWLKECKDVYIDLFIRLIAIYFVVFLIQQLSSEFSSSASTIFKSMEGEDFKIKALVFVFLIVGLLLFAKNAPKFICDILGIKGNDSISGMFKRAGGLAGGLLGTGKSGIAGAYNKYQKAKAANGGKWKPGDEKKRNQALRQAALSGLRGMRSSAWAGTRSALSGKGFKETRDAASRAADRAYDLYEARKDAHVRWIDYQKEVMKRRIGIRQDMEALNAEIKAAQESSDKAKAALDYVHNNLGAKFSQVQFGTDYVARVRAQLTAEGKLKGSMFDPSQKFVVGIAPDGSKIEMTMDEMAQGGKYSINTAMNLLKATATDPDGSLRKQFVEGKEREAEAAEQAAIAADRAKGMTVTPDDEKARIAKAKAKANQDGTTEFGQMMSEAQGMLDDLQGYADSFIVSASKRDQAYRDAVHLKDNPAFARIIEEATTAIKVNSSTSFGVDTQQKGQSKGMVDAHGDALPGMLGDWLGLNKKAGQTAQATNLHTQVSDPKVAAQAAAKKIADQYDKKS